MTLIGRVKTPAQARTPIEGKRTLFFNSEEEGRPWVKYPDGSDGPLSTEGVDDETVKALLAAPPPTKLIGANYEILPTDLGTILEVNSASTVTITVPAGLSEDGYLEVVRIGAGAVNIAEGAGAVVRPNGSKSIAHQYAGVSLRHRANDEWIATGDLT